MKLWVMLLPFTLKAQETPVIKPNLRNELMRLDSIPGLSGATISWCFRDMETGKIFEARDPKKLMIPASTIKLLTSAAALEILGSDFQYHTRIFKKGTQKGNTLFGDVLIIGSGDPSLGKNGDKDLEKILKALRDAGIENINGKLVIDPWIFPYNQMVIPRDRVWEDMGNYYGAGVFGLNWKGNSYDVDFIPGSKIGDTLHVQKFSNDQFETTIKTSVTITPDSAVEDIYFFGAPFSKELIATGRVSLSKKDLKECSAMPDPPLQFGMELLHFLSENKVNISGGLQVLKEKTPFQDTANLLLEILSPPLSELLPEVNQQSNNLYAETIARTAGMYLNSDGSAEDACRKIRRYLMVKKMVGDTSFIFNDGSGLSRKNIISTSAMTSLLVLSKNMKWFEAFKNSLSEPEISGTMKNFKKVNGLKGKTGSLGGIKCFAGYIKDNKGKDIAFAIMINHFISGDSQIKSQISKIFEAAGQNIFE